MTIGIIVDNYKLKKFEEELRKEKFFSLSYPLTEETTTIKITTTEDKIMEVRKLCQRLELHFKRSN